MKLTALLALALAALPAADPQSTEPWVLRGRPQTLHLYGRRGAEPVIVSSGDGGWIHLGPQVAELLAARGYFVVGFDSRSYLSAFAVTSATLTAEDVPADYRALVRYASAGSSSKPILIGVSEGAALSVLAASDPDTRALVGGVIGLGLGDINELGWRWKDALIYLTHGIPNEPTFSARAYAPRMAPLPLAVINSTRDEYVPQAEVEGIVAAAQAPKRLWMIDAADHRFSNAQAELALRLAEAIAWVRANGPG